MIEILRVEGLPEVRPGDDLAALIAGAVRLRDGDVVVVSQKIVSKAEGALAAVRPGEDRAAARLRCAREQAVRVVASAPFALIVQTRHGLVCANAGVDASNVPGGALALLPEDPDASARRLRSSLARRTGATVAVIVADTFGRPWRIGQTDVAIGVAGMAATRDERGTRDRQGAELEVTEVAVADELAAAADLVRRKADGVPVVLVRGFDPPPDDGGGARRLVRGAEEDLFPHGRGWLADALAGEGDRGADAGGRGSGGEGGRGADAGGRGSGGEGDRGADAGGRGSGGEGAGGRAAPAAPDDLRRALAGARAAGRGLARFSVREGAVLVRPLDGRGEAAMAVGAAAGALVAALLDLGYRADWRPVDHGGALVQVG